ncbi:MAG TPA: MBOAT family O-acyltransferase [Gemmatimonadales bacterium]|nr:MBOAT family O-acyltransferase [Gemmatimonadales bacterium]
MLFNSFIFLGVFLPITYTVFWLLGTAKARYVWLTVTGYVFYGYWDPRFCLLMAASTLVSYFAGLGFLRWSDPHRRKLCLVLPITVDLSLLGFFKYGGFLIDSVGRVLQALGAGVRIPAWEIVLPVGISFYTFHTITYIVDSYRGVIRPTRNLFEFSAYVSLFSQLVAGPIVRFRQIEEDLEHLGQADRRRWLGIGVSFFITGLLEKVLVADTLASYVDPTLAAYRQLSSAGAWLAMLGYTFQLYFDFAGYSDMAIGLGFMFGLRIPINFNSPYKALDPSDFWRRWHISLSSCLRDYLYIPLGGSREGRWKTYRNLMITMLLGGLWHGANWTFVVWGGYHGALLAAYRRWGETWNRLPAPARQLGMFAAVVVGWVFFRSGDFTMAGVMLHKMFVYTDGAPAAAGLPMILFLVFSGWWAMAGPNAIDLHRRWPPHPRRALALAAAFGACLAIMLGNGSSPFLYFQF